MSAFERIPATIIEFVIAFLLPVLLPALGGDTQAACALALDLLAEYNPKTGRELRLAGEAVLFSLEGLSVLGKSAAPGLGLEEQLGPMKWACSLSRLGHQAQRRLDELQRAPRIARPAPDAAEPCEPVPPHAPVAAEPQPLPEAAPPPAEALVPPLPAETQAPLSVAHAEAKLRSAEKLLAMMKAHHKGAPPPHTKAAQDIQGQQRAVDAARMTLAQARRRAQTAAKSQRLG